MSVTSIQLVRHGEHDELGRILSGRNDVAINAYGRRQALAVSDFAHRREVTRILSSPRRRCLETAELIASRLGLAVEVDDRLDELDMGAMSGRTFASLEDDHDWRAWNAVRAALPGGETIEAVVVRMMAFLLDPTIAGDVIAVSHAEPIRAVVLTLQRRPLNAVALAPIDPGSVTGITRTDGRLRLNTVNMDVRR